MSEEMGQCSWPWHAKAASCVMSSWQQMQTSHSFTAAPTGSDRKMLRKTRKE